MGETIKHNGIVESVEGRKAVVRILQSSACASCSAAQLCKSSDAKEKRIDIPNISADITVGQEIVVEGSVQQGLLATVWAYVIPLVLMVIALCTTLKFSGNEVTAALAALGILIPYFLLLFIFRNRLANKFTFKISNTKTV